MQIIRPIDKTVWSESEIYSNLLSLKGADIIELGCGSGITARAIVKDFSTGSYVACEVDQHQHDRNVSALDHSGIDFIFAGAESIPFEDSSFDVLFMFKSLHHVPTEKLGLAMAEIHRTLKPGGTAYISEPLFSGEFNDLIRIFHDEKEVREAAFEAEKEAIKSGLFQLSSQQFFYVPREFSDFQDFENKLLKVTHTSHVINDITYEEIKSKYFSNADKNGYAKFYAPMRVDLLKKI